jgi:hypothetical protein
LNVPTPVRIGCDGKNHRRSFAALRMTEFVYSNRFNSSRDLRSPRSQNRDLGHPGWWYTGVRNGYFFSGLRAK